MNKREIVRALQLLSDRAIGYESGACERGGGWWLTMFWSSGQWTRFEYFEDVLRYVADT